MKNFTSGWALQKPDQNYFKKFIRLNNISINGVVYPKRLVADIEDIPVLDFADAQDIITPDDIVIDMAANPELQGELTVFFEARGIKLVSIAQFLDRLISVDQQDTLRLPVAGVESSDVRKLKDTLAPDPFDEHFVDPESYAVASSLDRIFRHSEWQRMIGFDRDDTAGNVLFNVLRDLHERGVIRHLRVLDTPRVFLDAILKLKLHDAKASFTVSVSDHAIADLDRRAEFYCRSLSDCMVPFDSAEARRDDTSILLAGSPQPIVAAASAGAPRSSAICFMPRSILDYMAVKAALDEHRYRILLRQPNTMAHNLIAAILTPGLLSV